MGGDGKFPVKVRIGQGWFMWKKGIVVISKDRDSYVGCFKLLSGVIELLVVKEY